MNKSTHFTGQPIFSQLVKFLPKNLVYKVASDHQSDRYCKRFDTWHHLIAMLFACYGKCHSVREITTGMRALEGKLVSVGLKSFPKRSTFSDANKRRDAQVFADIYYALRKKWSCFLPDSSPEKNIHIIDATTITLFQEIFKGSGLSCADGKRKGGLKVHMSLQEGQTTPDLVRITNGAVSDTIFLRDIDLPKGSILLMDRGYRNYTKYKEWTEQELVFVTRNRPRTYVKELY